MSSNDKVHKAAKRRESASGFHYLNLFQCCPRKFYLRYVKGWSPKHTPMPLVQGSAFHEGKATWYLKKSEKKAIEVAMGIVEEAKKELESEVVYQEIAFRIPHFLHYWIERFGKSDLVEYKVVAVEKQLVVPVGSTPYSMTIRPDTILQNKQSGLKYIMETKTSGFSHRVTTDAVVYGDQATAYIYGVRKMLFPDVYGVLPDIAYWNSRSRDLSNMQFLRPEIVMRDEYALEQFEKGVGQVFTEINQKVEALKKGYEPEVLFPRNTYYCLSYSKPCEYAMVCQRQVKGMKVPPGLKCDRSKKSIGGYLDDIIAVS